MRSHHCRSILALVFTLLIFFAPGAFSATTEGNINPQPVAIGLEQILTDDQTRAGEEQTPKELLAVTSTVSVPFSTAAWFFGTALFLFVSIARRNNV